MTYKEVLAKMMKFCAYQERCQLEVRNKLYSFELTNEERERIIVDLIEENFVNEERFAEMYSRGKFNVKGWGKIKIKYHLQQKQVSEYCIKKALKKIDDQEYKQKCIAWLEKKEKDLNEDNPFVKNQKIANFLISKGFEKELVFDLVF